MLNDHATHYVIRVANRMICQHLKLSQLQFTIIMWSGNLQKQHLPSAWRDRCTLPVCCQLCDTVQRPRYWTKHAQNKLAAAQTKMERSMLNVTYKDLKTIIWAGETHFIWSAMSEKWNGPGQKTTSEMTDGPRVSPLGDHMTRKDDKGDQPSIGYMSWTKYWSNTIWHRTAQYRQTWRRHAEAFTEPRDTTAAQWWWW